MQAKIVTLVVMLRRRGGGNLSLAAPRLGKGRLSLVPQ